MENVRNISNVQLMLDGAFFCHIEVFDEWGKTWDAVTYVAREGDPAPVNCWLISEIDTGRYPISQWAPPPDPEPTPSSGPAVL
jgi:hypothetical protein